MPSFLQIQNAPAGECGILLRPGRGAPERVQTLQTLPSRLAHIHIRSQQGMDPGSEKHPGKGIRQALDPPKIVRTDRDQSAPSATAVQKKRPGSARNAFSNGFACNRQNACCEAETKTSRKSATQSVSATPPGFIRCFVRKRVFRLRLSGAGRTMNARPSNRLTRASFTGR